MPPLGPVKRRVLIRYLKQFGFEGPYPGSKHMYMLRGRVKVRIPNPHQSDISRGLLIIILQEAGIEIEEWEQLK